MEERNGHDREKLAAFVRECGPAALSKACRLTRDPEEAKDLVQEAFRRLTQHWERYGPPRSVACVFVVILRNAFIDRLRGEKRKNLLPLDASPDPEGKSSYHDLIAYREADILDQLIRQETVQKVRSCLKKLRPTYQRILILADLEGMEYAAVADELEIPLGTMKSRLSRARASFRKYANGLSQMV